MTINCYFSAFQIVNGIIYYSMIDFNGLFSYDIEKGESRFISLFEKEKISENELHLDSVLYKNSIIFIPYNGRYLSIYNTDTGKMSYIEMSKGKDCSYYKGIIYKRKLWLIPQVISSDNFDRFNICTIDLETWNIERYAEIDRFYTNSAQGIFSFGACSYQNKLYIALYGKNSILSINMENNQTERIVIQKINGLSTIDIIDDYFWISENNTGNIFITDINGNIKRVIGEEYSDRHYVRMFNCIRKLGDMIYVFPQNSDSIYCVKDVLKTVDTIEELHRRKRYSYCTGEILEYNNELFVAPVEYNRMISIGIDGELMFYDIKIDVDVLKNEKVEYYEHLDIGMYEEGEISLKEYIESICKQ